MKSFRLLTSTLVLAFLLPTLSYAQKVVVTKSGGKYHVDNCRTLTTSSDTKAVDVTEAKASKLAACTVCKPPTKPATGGKQCAANNKDGARCKRMTADKSGKCWQHS